MVSAVTRSDGNGTCRLATRPPAPLRGRGGAGTTPATARRRRRRGPGDRTQLLVPRTDVSTPGATRETRPATRRRAMRYGIKTVPQHTTWQAMVDVWRAADDIDVFESAWNWDHFYPLTGDFHGPNFEGWMMLAAMAQATRRIRLGVQVTGMVYRHPAVLANMAATVDVISERAARARAWARPGTRWSATPTASTLPPLTGAVRPLRRRRRGDRRPPDPGERRPTRAGTSSSPTPGASPRRSSSHTRRSSSAGGVRSGR